MEAEMPQTIPGLASESDKDTTPLDEQLARELHAQLNDPQNAPPLTRRRTRKAPSFYAPQGAGLQGTDASGAESGDGASPQRPAKRAREGASPAAPKPLATKARRASSHQQDNPTTQPASGSSGSQPTQNLAASATAATAEKHDKEGSGPAASHAAPHAKPQAPAQHSPFESTLLDPKPAPSQGAEPPQGPESPRGSGLRSRTSFKLPKLPMVLKGSKWYRGRLLRDSGARVFIEVSGLEEPAMQEWLPKDSERLWRGSYKGKDWRYLGDGAWEPRPKCCRRSSLKATGSSNSTDDQVRLGGTHRGEAPCLRCKTSSGNELSQDSKGSSSDRSSLAEDLFESQGNGTPASHPRGSRHAGPFDEEGAQEDEKEGACRPDDNLDARLDKEAAADNDLPPEQAGCGHEPPLKLEEARAEAAGAAPPSGHSRPEPLPHDVEGGSKAGPDSEQANEAGHAAASGLQCEEALLEDDVPTGKPDDLPADSPGEDQSRAAGGFGAEPGSKHGDTGRDGGSSDEPKPRIEPRRRNIRKKGMKRPRVPLPEEVEEEASGEDGDKAGAPPEQQTIRASSRIRTPAMKAEGSDFILTHELGRKAPRLTDSGDGGSAAVGRKGSGKRGGRGGSRKGPSGHGHSASLDHLSDGLEFAPHPSDSILAPHGMGRKARRGGLAKGSHMAPGLMRKQKGGLLRRESSGISAALVCGNSLGTLMQALHAHEHKTAPVQQPRELAVAASTPQHSSGMAPQLFTGTGGPHGQHGHTISPPNLGPLMLLETG
ncbi:hypothetical protein WJX84_011530 [Apatococcus fuscideae]|uniref:Uncharacterized protein n=1 Tax=Apatococcus fuscideae TaxID=2026836 RepID=A0AAW1SWV1_9CHLO